MARHQVDLDGTLAVQYWGDDYYGGEYNPGKIGEPIPIMVDRIKAWWSIGDEVSIFTCRMNPTKPEYLQPFLDAFPGWCMNVFGAVLEVSAIKDPYADDFWDNKAVRVTTNTGMISDCSDVKDPLDKSDQMGELM